MPGWSRPAEILIRPARNLGSAKLIWGSVAFITNPTVAEVQLLSRDGVFETRAVHVFVAGDAPNHGVICLFPTREAVKHLTVSFLCTRDN